MFSMATQGLNSQTITLPIYIEFYTWASQIQLDLNQYIIPPPSDVKQWREWVESLISVNPVFYSVPLPTKTLYPKDEDWIIWAEQFVNIVYTINSN